MKVFTRRLYQLLGLAMFASSTGIDAQTTATFHYTGSMQTWTVPACVNSITFDVQGAQGGGSHFGGSPGLGGRVTGTLAVTPGQVLNIFVGGQGGYGTPSSTITGGYNGGGSVPGGGSQVGGAGGGASDIRINGVALSDRVVVAGGGGGALCSSGGGGGGLTAGNASISGQCGGASNANGKGGDQFNGGAGGVYGCCGCTNGNNGSFGNGAAGLLHGSCNFSWTSGAGGGGWYGGGSGTTANAGGGGSSYTSSAASSVGHSVGFRAGNGVVTITFSGSQPSAPTASGATITCGSTATLTASGSTGQYAWYANSVGGSPLGTGSTYVTPSLTTNTTYYVEATAGNSFTVNTMTSSGAYATPDHAVWSGDDRGGIAVTSSYFYYV